MLYHWWFIATLKYLLMLYCVLGYLALVCTFAPKKFEQFKRISHQHACPAVALLSTVRYRMKRLIVFYSSSDAVFFVVVAIVVSKVWFVPIPCYRICHIITNPVSLLSCFFIFSIWLRHSCTTKSQTLGAMASSWFLYLINSRVTELAWRKPTTCKHMN